MALIDRRTGRHMAEAEGGEYVVNRKSTVRYRDLVEAINENDMARVQQAALQELAATSLIRMDTEATQLFIDQKKEIHAHTTVNNNLSTKQLEKRVDRATDEIRGLREDMASVEVQHDPSGRTERFNHTTRRVRR